MILKTSASMVYGQPSSNDCTRDCNRKGMDLWFTIVMIVWRYIHFKM